MPIYKMSGKKTENKSTLNIAVKIPERYGLNEFKNKNTKLDKLTIPVLQKGKLSISELDLSIFKELFVQTK